MLDTHSLKAGDKLRAVVSYGDGQTWYAAGDVVTFIEMNGRYVVVCDVKGKTGGFRATDFEKVETAPTFPPLPDGAQKYRAVIDRVHGSYVTSKSWKVVEDMYAQKLTAEAAEAIAKALNAAVPA